MASSSQTISASPSSSAPWKYDVFLSFRGPDTRKGITSELYHRLQGRGTKTFMDDRDLQVGDVISPTLLAAIKESRFAIVVLSPDYAFSTWCLQELREICLSMEDNSRILPLFYDVDPTDVRHQKRSLKEAKDDQVYAVGVYGIGGVGKTTVVKHVSAQACKNGIFDHVIMAVVSQNPDFEKLQDALAEQLGIKLLEETEIGRIGGLNKEIMRREKLLTILDDVWGRTELSKVFPATRSFKSASPKC